MRRNADGAGTAARLRPCRGALERVSQDVVCDTGQGANRAVAALQRPFRAISLSAERQRRRRERLRDGKIVLSVEVSGRMVEAMLAAGMVDERQSRCRADLAQAIEEALADWAGRALETFRHA